MQIVEVSFKYQIYSKFSFQLSLSVSLQLPVWTMKNTINPGQFRGWVDHVAIERNSDGEDFVTAQIKSGLYPIFTQKSQMLKADWLL